MRDVRRAGVWTDQPVDLTAKRELEEKIQGWTDEIESFKSQVDQAKKKVEDIRNQVQDNKAEKVSQVSGRVSL